MSKTNFINLIHKRLSNQLSANEQTKLNDWESQSKSNKSYVKDLEKIWKTSDQYKRSYQPNVEKGLAQLQARIQHDATTSATIRQLKPRSNWMLRIAAAILFLVAIGFLLKTYFSISTELVASTKIGETKVVTLVDGSIVRLNEGSTLTYPETFATKNRQVELRGEAFFDIQKKKDYPFEIVTPQTEIEVLGTSFNVRALVEESTTEVSVKTGKVQLSPLSSDQSIFLNAKEGGYYNHRSQVLKKEENPSLNGTSWIDNKLNFQKTMLKTVLKDLERYFKVDIVLQNTQLESCKYTSLFNAPNLEQILTLLSTAFELELEKTGQTSYTLVGGQCN